MTDIMDHLEKLADQIAVHAIEENVDIKTKLDSFKALASFQFNKNNPKKNPKEDEDDATPTFDGFQRSIAAATGSGESSSD